MNQEAGNQIFQFFIYILAGQQILKFTEIG